MGSGDEGTPTSSELLANERLQPIAQDDMRDEYDFASMKGGVQGKYIKGFHDKVTAVILDEGVTKIFPDSASVNEALRTLARVFLHKEEGSQQ